MDLNLSRYKIFNHSYNILCIHIPGMYAIDINIVHSFTSFETSYGLVTQQTILALGGGVVFVTTIGKPSTSVVYLSRSSSSFEYQ